MARPDSGWSGASWEAIQRPGGAVGRGPRRWYVEIHPQNTRGFVDLVTHPWVVGMCEAVLGPSYHDGLPAAVRDHLVCRVVPVTQKHDIEGLVMGTFERGIARAEPSPSLRQPGAGQNGAS